jgi:hypothetical protein
MRVGNNDMVRITLLYDFFLGTYQEDVYQISRMENMKKKEGWAIMFTYDGKREFLFMFPTKHEAKYRYKTNQLFKPQYTIVPFTYELPLTSKK